VIPNTGIQVIFSLCSNTGIDTKIPGFQYEFEKLLFVICSHVGE